ncbi:MAG: response regulator [Verrucomicrobiota bacterium]|jgi:CheY-like chemotaxis protein
MSFEESASDPIKRQKSPRQRILVVDDAGSMRQLKVDSLLDSGYDVEEAKDGADGWEALQHRHFDLVITDNKMPRMTGIEMIEKMRTESVRVPVMMTTGFMPVFELARKPWLKPDAVLATPFSTDEFLSVVKSILGHGDDLTRAMPLPKEPQ